MEFDGVVEAQQTDNSCEARNSEGFLSQRASRSISTDALRQPRRYTEVVTRMRLDPRAPRNRGSPSWYEPDLLHHVKGILLAFDGNGHPHYHHEVPNLCSKPPLLTATHHAPDAVPRYGAPHGTFRRHRSAHSGLKERQVLLLGDQRPLYPDHEVCRFSTNYGHARGVSHYRRVGVRLQAPGPDPDGPRALVHDKLLQRCDENSWY